MSSDVHFVLSAPGASAGNATAGAVGSSWGGYMATSPASDLSGTALDNLFNDLTGAQNAASQVDYSCVFVLNTHATNTMLNSVAWLPTSSDSGVGGAGTAHAIGLDTVAASVKTSSSVQGLIIVSAVTAPVGVSFVAPSSTSAGGVTLGNILPGYCRAIWIRRTARNSSPLNADGFTIEIDFDTQG